MIEHLVEEKAQVTAFVRGGCTPANILHLLSGISVTSGDIGSSEATDLIRDPQPEIIFHLAAVAEVSYSFKHLPETMHVNASGTLYVLEAARKLDVERVVIVSSAAVYGPSESPIDETHPVNPSTPYGASKAAADRLAYSYWKSYGVRVAIARLFTTYGPRHTYDVIPVFIKRVLSSKPPIIHGTGNATRDFLYIDDAVGGLLLIGSRKEAVGEVFNFGTGKTTRISELAEIILQLSGSNLHPEYTEARPGGRDTICCNFEKARRSLNWNPLVSLHDGLKRTICWYKDNPSTW
jgi:nucleoside-diphosphate-sugar epimerase